MIRVLLRLVFSVSSKPCRLPPMSKRHNVLRSVRGEGGKMKILRRVSMLALLLTCFAPACVSSTDPPMEGTILFDTNRDGNSEIYSISADGSNPTRLTNSPAQDYGPWPSPDGSRIVFFSRPSRANLLYMMDGDGRNMWFLAESCG